MIQKFKIENLWSLKDTGFIPRKPNTILLGGNSSGKSTFLRSFPLITQSVNKHLRNAVAWFDDNLVDLGDFFTAKTHGCIESEPIRFSFKIGEFNRSRKPYIGYSLHNLSRFHNFNNSIVSIELSSLPENQRYFYISCNESYALLLYCKNQTNVSWYFHSW